mgnify:CR=1 FL=1
MPQDMRATDLRKEQRSYPEHRTSPYPMPGRDPRDMRGDPRSDPRDMRGDPRGDHRDLRGGPPGGIDLSIRQPEGLDKVAHGYKGDPRDFDQMHRQGDPYRGQTEDPQQRKAIPMVTPPPAHSHRRSPFPMQPEMLKRREDVMDKSPGMYPDRQAVSPNMRGE